MNTQTYIYIYIYIDLFEPLALPPFLSTDVHIRPATTDSGNVLGMLCFVCYSCQIDTRCAVLQFRILLDVNRKCANESHTGHPPLRSAACDHRLRERPGEVQGIPIIITVRGYCLDVPRFEESLNNQKQHKTIFEERGI